jgi:hypothetical protein
VRSYSIRTQFNAAPPESGKEIFALLNTAQKTYWGKFAPQLKTGFPRLVMELWVWPQVF